MKVSSLDLKQTELEAIYKILKEYEEHATNSEEESYNEYYDRYEEPIDKKVMHSVLKKIGMGLSQEIKKEIDKDFLRQKYHTFNNEINENTYKKLEKAFKQLKTVEIKYFNMDSAKFKKRKLDIYHRSRKYIIGYCHLRNGIRKFRTSRIISAKIMDLPYVIPTHFDKNDY